MARGRAKPMRKYWFSIRDAGNHKWKVFLADKCSEGLRHEEEGEPLGPFVAITHFDKREIEVSVRMTLREIHKATMHELMHACGGTKKLDADLRRGEEHFILRSECSMLAMVRQLGATLPPLPAGVRLSARGSK